jgi:pyruvate ferredoxin oxidoreductase gamma subunit
VIVQDATILREVDVEEGLKPDGIVLINTEKTVDDLKLKTQKVFAISAEELARRILGRPIINTALLGTFAGISGELSLKAAVRSVQSKFPGDLGLKNARVVEESFRAFQKEVV